MAYLIFGLAALVVILLMLRGATSLQPGTAARAIRAIGGIVALGAATFFLVRGAFAYAIGLASFGIYLLSLAGSPGGVRPMPGAGGGSGQTSRVETDHLEMELDRETGGLSGRVRKGVFAGRDIDTMAPAEIALLWQDCRFSDPQSAQLLEAYLDRVHPSWREDMASAEAGPGAGGQMTQAEALEVLGLKPNPSAEDVRRAHKALILKIHPDHGGSAYLAQKINEARDILLRTAR
ncbi:MAG: molecular chaperone DnaJ [Pseudomonadota bacterium]